MNGTRIVTFGGLLGCLSLMVIQPLESDEKRDRQNNAASHSIKLTGCRLHLINDVLLASDRPGILKYVELKEGDRVEADKTVAELNDEVARAQLKVVEEEAKNDIEIRYAVKAAEVADAEYNKSVAANKRQPGTIPDVEIRRAKLAFERSSLQIEQAEAQKEVARLNYNLRKAELDTFKIVAPFDGIVTRVFKRKGEAVRQGDPIVQLVSTRRLRVEGRLSIKDGWTVQPGDSVDVTVSIPQADLPVEKEVFKGHVVFVDVRVAPVDPTVRVWAEIENRDGMVKAGLQATMLIHLSKKQPAK